MTLLCRDSLLCRPCQSGNASAAIGLAVITFNVHSTNYKSTTRKNKHEKTKKVDVGEKVRKRCVFVKRHSDDVPRVLWQIQGIDAPLCIFRTLVCEIADEIDSDVCRSTRGLLLSYLDTAGLRWLAGDTRSSSVAVSDQSHISSSQTMRTTLRPLSSSSSSSLFQTHCAVLLQA